MPTYPEENSLKRLLVQLFMAHLQELEYFKRTYSKKVVSVEQCRPQRREPTMRRSYPDMERPQQGVAEFPKAATPAEEASPAPKIKIRIRFDYRGLPRPPRFFFGGKGAKEVAEEIRQQQANMWRHVPIQGVQIEDLEFFELYSVYDEIEETLAVYAPVELRAAIDSLEDILRFVCRDEFRRVEFIEPAQLNLSNRDLERLFFKFGETLQQRLKEQEFK
ncbi:MAG: hypothetical protein WBJ12_00495 [Dethiobacteria bacterium]|jgi:hypothetical protein